MLLGHTLNFYPSTKSFSSLRDRSLYTKRYRNIKKQQWHTNCYMAAGPDYSSPFLQLWKVTGMGYS